MLNQFCPAVVRFSSQYILLEWFTFCGEIASLFDRKHTYISLYLDPALHSRLVSAPQRPNLKPTTQVKIKSVFKQ